MEAEDYNKLSKKEKQAVPFMQKPKSDRIGILVTFGIFILIIGSIAKCAFSENEPENYWSADNSHGAYWCSQSYVKANLKSPASADFPLSDYKSWRLDTANYVIKGYVDSQNGFGAMIRTNWRTEMVFNGGDPHDGSSWTVKAFSFEE